jgi:hypothetical protein
MSSGTILAEEEHHALWRAQLHREDADAGPDFHHDFMETLRPGMEFSLINEHTGDPLRFSVSSNPPDTTQYLSRWSCAPVFGPTRGFGEANTLILFAQTVDCTVDLHEHRHGTSTTLGTIFGRFREPLTFAERAEKHSFLWFADIHDKAKGCNFLIRLYEVEKAREPPATPPMTTATLHEISGEAAYPELGEDPDGSIAPDILLTRKAILQLKDAQCCLLGAQMSCIRSGFSTGVLDVAGDVFYEVLSEYALPRNRDSYEPPHPPCQCRGITLLFAAQAQLHQSSLLADLRSHRLPPAAFGSAPFSINAGLNPIKFDGAVQCAGCVDYIELCLRQLVDDAHRASAAEHRHLLRAATDKRDNLRQQLQGLEEAESRRIAEHDEEYVGKENDAELDLGELRSRLRRMDVEIDKLDGLMSLQPHKAVFLEDRMLSFKRRRHQLASELKQHGELTDRIKRRVTRNLRNMSSLAMPAVTMAEELQQTQAKLDAARRIVEFADRCPSLSEALSWRLLEVRVEGRVDPGDGPSATVYVVVEVGHGRGGGRLPMNKEDLRKLRKRTDMSFVRSKHVGDDVPPEDVVDVDEEPNPLGSTNAEQLTTSTKTLAMPLTGARCRQVLENYEVFTRVVLSFFAGLIVTDLIHPHIVSDAKFKNIAQESDSDELITLQLTPQEIRAVTSRLGAS